MTTSLCICEVIFLKWTKVKHHQVEYRSNGDPAAFSWHRHNMLHVEFEDKSMFIKTFLCCYVMNQQESNVPMKPRGLWGLLAYSSKNRLPFCLTCSSSGTSLALYHNSVGVSSLAGHMWSLKMTSQFSWCPHKKDVTGKMGQAWQTFNEWDGRLSFYLYIFGLLAYKVT